MTRIKSTDDPVVRFAHLMAKMYFYLAEELMEQLGEEKGEEAILRAIGKFGAARVMAMKEEAKELGLELNCLDTYRTVRDMPGIGWENNPDNVNEITHCPMQDAWAELGDKGRKIGYLYCQIDHVLYDAFGVDMERPLCLAKGDKSCLFLLKER
ncbi:MAG: L-2-amino-thiazoline-4-carboxylic acid hydrolase [Bacillota bacterium]